jgi:hypothetical protein
MKFLRISSLYPQLISQYYNNFKFIKKQRYKSQYNHAMSQKFSISNFLTREIKKKNIETFEIISNLKYLQLAWLKEFGDKNKKKSIIAQQILYYKPDIIFFGNIDLVDNEILEILNEDSFKKVIKIVYHCAPITQNQIYKLKHLTFLVTCVEDYKKKFKYFIDTILIPHAFDRSCYKEVKRRDIDISFIGSLFLKKKLHLNRVEILYKIMRSKMRSYISVNFKNFYINFFIIILKNIIFNAPIVFKILYIFINSRKALFGKRMYEVLQRSKVMLNMHIADTKYAGNMRLFEGTGSGCLVVTDYKQGLEKFFVNKKEILVYNSDSMALDLIKNSVNNYKSLKKISQSAQKKTYSMYNYSNSAKLLLSKIKDLTE